MANELPTDVLNKIRLIERSRFATLNKSIFNSKQSVEEVIRTLNRLNTSEAPIGAHLQLQSNPTSKARKKEDPPSRSVTFSTGAGVVNPFSGQVTMMYSNSSSGQPTNISFSSQVTISAFGANFGAYTQTNVLSSSYQMSNGSTVVAFQVQGSYTPPLVGLAGLSNDWVFTGYLVFPGGGGNSSGTNGAFDPSIHGHCTMDIYEQQ